MMTETYSMGPYRLAFTSSIDPMLLLDVAGRIQELNAATERLLDRPAAEARGKLLDEVLSPAASLAPLVEEALRAQLACVLPPDTRLCLSPDRTVDVDGSLSPLIDAASACSGALLVLRDVTEQRKKEREMRDREAYIFGALDQLDAGFVLFGPDERLVYCNAKLKEIYPQGVEQMVPGTSVEEMLLGFCRNGGHLEAGMSADEFMAERLAAYRNPGSATIRRVGGRWIRVADTRTSDGSVVSLRTDVTALKETELALERERTFARLLIDHDPNSIFVKERSGRILFVNKAYADVWGTTPEAFIKKHAEEFMKRDEATRLESVDEVVFETMRPVTITHPITFPTGEVRWFNSTKMPLVEPDGTVHILGIAIDITERKKHDELIASTITELERQKQAVVDKLAVIEEQQALIRALSTPILQVAEGVLAIPVIGVMDDVRANAIMSKLLEEIERTRARYAIIDVTGVDAMDAAMAGGFVRMASAIRLLGAQGILTGMKPAVARTICALGVDLHSVVTSANLRAGLELCLRGMGGAPGSARER